MTLTDSKPDQKTIHGTSHHRTAPITPVVRWGRNLWTRIKVFFIRHVYEGILIRREIERFYMVFGGHIFFQTLNAAVRFDLFTLLARNPGLIQEEIASRLEIANQPARILLLGLTSVGFLRKKGLRYYTTYVSRMLFSKDSPRNVISYVLLQDQGMYKAMPHFVESMRQYRNVGLKEFPGEEPTFYQRLSHNPALEQIFQDAMQQLSIQTNATLTNYVDLSRVRHLVDVGGGDGTNILTLAKKNPHLKASVFDLPSVCEIANKRIASFGLSDRLNAIPGNCFEDPLPQGVDCFLFSHFFTIWSEKKDRLLLKKCFDALPPGGQVIVFNMMQRDDGTGPLSAAVGSPYFLTLATGEGMLYTAQEYETWMREAGFAAVRRQLLPKDHAFIIGVKPTAKPLTSSRYKFIKDPIARVPETGDLYDHNREVEAYISKTKSGVVRMIERFFVRSLLKAFGDKSHLRVLDVGTGPGWIPAQLAIARPKWSLSALDASSHMLDKAEAYAISRGVRLEWVLGKADEVPFPSEEFDLIISHFAFSEFPDGKTALKEMERLLKPGGSLVIQDLHRPTQWQFLLLALWTYLTKPFSQFNHQYMESLRGGYTVEEVEGLLEEIGLKGTVRTWGRAIGGFIQVHAMKPAAASAVGACHVA